MSGNNMRKAKTGKSALGLVGIAIGVILLVIAVAYALSQPGVLETVASAAVIIVLAIVGIAFIIGAVIALSAIPMYAYKGEQYQENVDYRLDDVKSVKESSPEDKKNDCFLATDCISAEKLASSEYNTNVFNFSEPAVRKLLADIQVEEQNYAEMLYKYKTVNAMK